MSLEAIRDRLDEIGPPWGNPALLAREVEAGFLIAYQLLDVAEAAKVCVEQSAADNPFVGYAFEALRDALARLEDVAKL